MSNDSDTPVTLTTTPSGYTDWLAELKARIHTAQQRATLAVNRERVLLYWQIGRDILVWQAQQGWQGPCRLDFLGVSKEADERSIESAIVQHNTQFLIVAKSLLRRIS